MSRCDYDTIFQRVFCVTLVAIALTFTVILTSVFVDIDGLLSGKNKQKHFNVPVVESDIQEVQISNLRPDAFFKEERNYDDEEENYRSKRSLESPNFLFHVKNPKMKSILTNRLATLLEELDAEETVPESRNPNGDNIKSVDKPKVFEEDTNKDGIFAAIKNGLKNDRDDKRSEDKRSEDDMLHLAMHNILLQGIIGHMDLNDVYKKVHSLVKNFKDIDEDTPKENRVQEAERPSEKEPSYTRKEYTYPKLSKDSKRSSKILHNPSVEENKFFEELVKCDKLQNDITNTNQIKNIESKDFKLLSQKAPNLLIKTIIDITSKARPEMNANSRETIKGIIKLIYNGKSVKFSRLEDDENQRKKERNVNERQVLLDEAIPKDIDEKKNDDIKDIDPPEPVKTKPERRNSNAYLNKIIDDYFKKYPQKNDDDIDDKYNEKMETKRLKRHIKIRYEDDDVTTVSPPKTRDKNDDDELFVEIETHFDSKGMKGDKKKKLIKSIIEKIQKAIHSDLDKFNDGKKKKHKRIQFKKRIQNPLEKDKKLFTNKIMLPFDTVEQRHSDPISKAVPLPNPLPYVADKSGENWKKTYFGPGFLTVSKSLNSAEMGEVDVDYNKIMGVNGIPQRLQKPLNTDISEEMLNGNTYFDMGNLKFFIKNIDGTGLSIGFNQYTDEPPDPETIKLFTGIEHLVKTYNQKDATEKAPLFTGDKDKSSEERYHQISKRDVHSNRNEHLIIRRSVKEMHEKDYHSNEYKIIFDSNFLPYNSYQDIYEGNKKSVALTINKQTENINTYDHGLDNMEIIRNNIEIKELPALMDEKNNIFQKKLKPSDILNIASMLDRKKRSLNVHKITNLKKKMKMNKYLNTRAVGRKKIILNKKRSKRQIDKIRIIASDTIPSRNRHAADNIFLVNDEDLLADRAIIREVETPDVVDLDERMGVEERMGEQYDMVPVMYEDPPYTTNVFDGRSRHNQLMSKYPHIFMEEVARSKEDYTPFLYNKFEIKTTRTPVYKHVTTEKPTTIVDIAPRLEEIVNAIEPKPNYKLTVKILPKNMTSLNTGFKEIHASINKSFNKDGLTYSSLVNVSEISKIEKLHNSTLPTTVPKFTTPSTFIQKIQDQQNRMDILLKQHKKRIDEQLEHLKKERVNLDSIALKNIEENTTEKPEITTLKPDSLLHMSNDDVTKLLASALFQLQSQNEFSTTVTTTTRTTTTKPTTPAPKQDNITHEILQQINRNTEMLQTFLQKLTDKLSKEKAPLRHNSEELRPAKFDYNIPNYWKPFHERAPYQPPLEGKNETHLSIPLVYSFQPPYPVNNQPQHIPIASVVYHGHIHTDSLKHLNQKSKDARIDTKVDAKNKTKYFIDEMEDFKVIPVKKEIKTEVKSTTPKV